MKNGALRIKGLPASAGTYCFSGKKWSLRQEVLRQVTRPLCAFLKRWGAPSMKRIAWRQDFVRGINIHDVGTDYRSAICDWIERYSMEGDVLDLGCSDGHVGLGLTLDSYSSYTGVDISDLALSAAHAKLAIHDPVRRGKHRFLVGDIATFRPDFRPSVVLFKDSLYYLPRRNLIDAIQHYRKFLTERGVFVVQMDNIKRHGWIRDLIIENCEVIEDLVYDQQDFVILVFR